ncbi:hypothetical protein PVK06_048377 [Gossypium arboreum]|uniref:DUF7745 domain-containing protein n=1 Tax=Gossypium arboreum TaxID=29729 RepID=A0ABR0MG35_GOSAR|nr:hypothetical protein PVK06_048377 [Gossypium arboreum]
MTIVVTPLSGSEKLRLREVFASVQDSGSLSGYIRTYGFMIFSSPYEHLFLALAQFWNPAYSCFTFGEVDLVPIVEEYTALLRCPRIFYRVFFENYSPLKDIVASSRKVDMLEENWIALLRNLQSKDVEWRAPWMVPGEILYRCDSFDWVPLLGIWGAIGYAPLLVLRQHGLRQFIPATHGLAQSEFVYRGSDYKRKVSEVSSAWKKTCRLKGMAINPATTPEYVQWRSKRINDNVCMTKMEEAQPMEEYLQKEVEKVRKEKRKVEEDRDDLKEEYKKTQISLKRVGLGRSSEQWQKEAQEEKARAEYWEKKFQEIRSQNLALEKENKGLKTKVTELGRSLRWHRNHDPTVELKELKSKVEDLEVALHDGELQIEQLEAQEDCIKGELHQLKGQVRDRDYIIWEAIAQIREIFEYVRDLAVRADPLSMMYESASDKGRELALLLDKVRTLGIRANAYMKSIYM